MWGQGDPKNLKNHLRFNKVPILRANNWESIGDAIFLRSDSNSLTKNKVVYQFLAFNLLPLSKYKHFKLEKITNARFRASEWLKSEI